MSRGYKGNHSDTGKRRAIKNMAIAKEIAKRAFVPLDKNDLDDIARKLYNADDVFESDLESVEDKLISRIGMLKKLADTDSKEADSFGCKCKTKKTKNKKPEEVDLIPPIRPTEAETK